MNLLHVTLATLTKRAIEWTGILERLFRQFIHALPLNLSESDLKCLFFLPDYLVDLAQSGVLEAIELRAGNDGLLISLSMDPHQEDDLDTSMLTLCDFSGKKLMVNLLINDIVMARSLGVEQVKQLSSDRLLISINLPGADLYEAVLEPSENRLLGRRRRTP